MKMALIILFCGIVTFILGTLQCNDLVAIKGLLLVIIELMMKKQI